MSYKSSSFRAQPHSEQPDKYRSQARQLQELFPSWSSDDLHSVLLEVAGDVELAATRISEGHAEQWGSVTRKKDKKQPTSVPTSSSKEGRGAGAGGRGGRGGRGGPGRGGAVGTRGRGAPGGGRGGAVHPATNGRHTPSGSTNGTGAWGSPSPAVNGVAPDAASKPAEEGAPWPEETPAAAAPPAEPAPSTSESAAASAWGTTANASTWSEPEVNGKTSASKPTKTPATSKLSWAQIARPQEKPTPLPPAPVTAPPPASAPAAFEPTPVPEPEPEAPPQTSWEEPTTVEPTTWEEDAQAQPADVWPPSAEPVQEAAPEETYQLPEPSEPEPPAPAPSALPAQLQRQAPAETAPEPAKPQSRPAPVSHRSSARYKNIDQPVVMPSSNYGVGLEKIGMQFGSLSLGGDSLDSSLDDAPAPEPTISRAPAPEPSAPEPQQSPIAPAQTHEPQPPASISPNAPHSSLSVGSSLFQQSIPQQQQQSVPQPQHSLPSSVSQPAIQPAAPPQSAATSSPMHQFAQQQQQQQLANHHQQQQQQQPLQSQSHLHSQQHQYAQHGLASHLDPTQGQAQQTPQHAPQPTQPQQQQGGIGHSYFRQTEAPYFHTPTPPAGQVQESPYGGGFGGQQAQHQQAQPSHLGGFGSQDYGYNDGQRGFYESYSQQSGFGGRNPLGHDDVKGLPGAQQPPVNTGLPPPANSQSAQHGPSQGAPGQSQPAVGGQGPQQQPGYAPVPYYYPYQPNQYYGSPYNSGYGVPQPFVKYPTMFQPGPPGPGSAPSPVAKQGPAAVQPQSNPYSQSLYGQQHPSSGYEDVGYQQHHSQPSVGNNLPSNDYGKHQQQLYGGHGAQGFMGLGQGNGPAAGPPIGQRAGGASPEAAYKPYAPSVKDVGAGVGGVAQAGVAQGRAGAQPPQSGYYGANRFASSVTAGPQAQQGQQQGQGPQGHVGYPQGQSDGGFYSYQPRQQQGYWQ
ncbi:hypothetical protein PLICRDRAFT_124097 [Plicaturopsis crispa FD-325 SS-3]|nr:hypothetical protein PLICRDRAFT_124097 [Plicaturopsis crispa FD-325 SS-3]